MLRVTTFSASWGSCPLRTVMTHSAKAVSSAPSGSLSPDPLQLTNERVAMLYLPGNQCSWGSLLPLLPFLSLKPVASSLHLPHSFYTPNHEDWDVSAYNTVIKLTSCPCLLTWKWIGVMNPFTGTTSFNILYVTLLLVNEDVCRAQFAFITSSQVQGVVCQKASPRQQAANIKYQ